MLQQEFERRTGMLLTDAQWENINRYYMEESANNNVVDFCDDWNLTCRVFPEFSIKFGGRTSRNDDYIFQVLKLMW